MQWPHRWLGSVKLAGTVNRAFSTYMQQPEDQRAKWLSDNGSGLGSVVYKVWQILGLIPTDEEATDAG